jgi:heme exporter protein C
MAKRVLLGAAAVLLVIAAAYAAFFVAPEERTMGVLQRIFYFHVSCAWAGLTAFSVGFLGNLLYVWKRREKYDWLGVSCAEVGVVFSTVVLISVPFWARRRGAFMTWDAADFDIYFVAALFRIFAAR